MPWSHRKLMWTRTDHIKKQTLPSGIFFFFSWGDNRASRLSDDGKYSSVFNSNFHTRFTTLVWIQILYIKLFHFQKLTIPLGRLTSPFQRLFSSLLFISRYVYGCVNRVTNSRTGVTWIRWRIPTLNFNSEYRSCYRLFIWNLVESRARASRVSILCDEVW